MTSDPRAALREKTVYALDQLFLRAITHGWTVSREYDCAVTAIDIVLEEAARVADANALEAWDFGADETRGLMRLQAADIAAAIRGMKGTD